MATANGAKDAGEGPLAGWRVFVDKNNNGVVDRGEPSTRKSSTSQYEFDGLRAGASYRVRVLPPGPGYVATTPTVATANVNALGTTVTNFALQRTGLIRGNLFNDTNRNGRRDAGESGVHGFRIYLDLNGNGHFDAKKDLVGADGCRWEL